MSEALSGASASASGDELLAELVAEITDRLHAGERVDIADYAVRCPGREEELRRLLSALEGMDGLKSSPGPGSADAATNKAEPTEVSGTLGDFRIVRELGRGGMGPVRSRPPTDARQSLLAWVQSNSTSGQLTTTDRGMSWPAGTG